MLFWVNFLFSSFYSISSTPSSRSFFSMGSDIWMPAFKRRAPSVHSVSITFNHINHLARFNAVRFSVYTAFICSVCLSIGYHTRTSIIRWKLFHAATIRVENMKQINELPLLQNESMVEFTSNILFLKFCFQNRPLFQLVVCPVYVKMKNQLNKNNSMSIQYSVWLISLSFPRKRTHSHVV